MVQPKGFQIEGHEKKKLEVKKIPIWTQTVF